MASKPKHIKTEHPTRFSSENRETSSFEDPESVPDETTLSENVETFNDQTTLTERKFVC